MFCLLPLENPWQTSAYDYATRYSAKSPKFSRAMAVGSAITSPHWVSGTASILDSESGPSGRHRKTDRAERLTTFSDLISRENCERHGLPGAGAELSDLAKVRVYIKTARGL